MDSIINKILDNQKKFEKVAKTINPEDKIAFVFSTKDRPDLSLKSLPTVDEAGFDIIWLDGSDTKEGRELPQNYKFKNANFIEYQLDVRGGPDKAIQHGLKRMIALGYDYCGLIENDIVFEKGWFKKLVEVFNLAAKDGIAVGAGSVRTYESRVVECMNGYSVNWSEGAGMILLSREATQIILDNYEDCFNFGRELCLFYAKFFGIDLRKSSEPARYFLGKPASADFSYDMFLYKNGLSSVGTIPSMVEDIGIDLQERELKYITLEKSGSGIFYPKISFFSETLLRLNVVILRSFWFFWQLIGRIRVFKKVEDFIENKIRKLLRKKRELL